MQRLNWWDTLCPKKRLLFIFGIIWSKISIIFGTNPSGKLTLANYKFAHFTWKMSPHSLPSGMQKSHFSITLVIGISWVFKLLLDKGDSSCRSTAEVITFTYFLAYCFLFESQGQSPYSFTSQMIRIVFHVMVFSKGRPHSYWAASPF